MNLILLGAPGAGKGTQAELLVKKLSIPAISTGNMLREAIANGTELGKKAKQYMDEGSLVPDELILGIVADRVAQPDCQKGFILDGVPRTVAQAEALEQMGVVIDKVVDLEVADEIIIHRLAGRRVCSACGASYHLENKPSREPDRCDRCGGALIIRQDDAPETVKGRLKAYHELTEPLIAFYRERGKLVVVEGHESIADTSELLLKALEA